MTTADLREIRSPHRCHCGCVRLFRFGGERYVKQAMAVFSHVTALPSQPFFRRSIPCRTSPMIRSISISISISMSTSSGVVGSTRTGDTIILTPQPHKHDIVGEVPTPVHVLIPDAHDT